MKQFAILVCGCLISILLSGCSLSTYIPTTNNAPLLKSKDEVHVSGSLAGNGYAMQIAYAPATNIGVLGNGNIGKQQKDPANTLPFDRHSYGELAVGYFNQFENGSVYETYTGYGYGTSFIRETSFDSQRWFYSTESSGRYTCLFLLQNYGGSIDSSVDIAASIRISSVNFTSYSPIAVTNQKRLATVLIEPAITMKYGWPSFKFVLQTMYTKPIHDNTVFEINTVNVALGMEIVFPIKH
jgi:hypothetical protein